MTITIAIIAITSGISLLIMGKRQALYKLTMNPAMILKRGEYYRLITSGFIHLDLWHLIFNMFSLYWFGTMLEYIFQREFGTMGTAYFIVLYLLGIIISDVPTLFKQQNNYSYHSLGASGAVSAVIFGCIIFEPLYDIYIYLIRVPGFIYGAIYLIYSYQSARKSRDGINHDAHLFGALFGLAFCIILKPQVVSTFIEKLAEWKLF